MLEIDVTESYTMEYSLKALVGHFANKPRIFTNEVDLLDALRSEGGGPADNHYVLMVTDVTDGDNEHVMMGRFPNINTLTDAIYWEVGPAVTEYCMERELAKFEATQP